MYMCLIPNDFRDRAISLCSSKIVDKEEILRTISNTGIYCSSDKVGTVCLVQYIFENATVNINALCYSCEDIACCSSVQCTMYCTAGNELREKAEESPLLEAVTRDGRRKRISVCCSDL
jgi:hypothetical protein